MKNKRTKKRGSTSLFFRGLQEKRKIKTERKNQYKGEAEKDRITSEAMIVRKKQQRQTIKP